MFHSHQTLAWEALVAMVTNRVNVFLMMYQPANM